MTSDLTGPPASEFPPTPSGRGNGQAAPADLALGTMIGGTDAPLAAPGAPQSGPQPPPFYQRPEPVLPATHKDVKIRPEFDFSFAANINTVPITVPEFTLAARHFPIMFLGPELVPTVALGFNPQVNLFVGTNGQWANGQYIPAYIRRYPFILMGSEVDQRLHLGIDAAAHSTRPDARPLFDGDKESPTLTQGITLCEQFHGAYLFTRDFSRALQGAGIIEQRGLELELSPGRKSTIGSFFRVSEEKFKQLPDATITEWFKSGFLYAIYFHLQSMNNWELLIGRNAMLAQTMPQGVV